MGLAFIAIGFFEPVRDRIVSPSVIDFAGIGNQIAAAFLQKADFVQHTRQTPHRESATAETKQIKSILRFESIHKIRIGVFDIFGQANAKRLAQDYADFFAQCAAKHAECTDAGIVKRDLVFVPHNEFIHPLNIRIILAIFIASSVDAHHDIFAHVCYPRGMARLMLKIAK